MLVTEVKKFSDRKCRIFLEDGSSFVLYRAEAGKLGIHEQEDLSEETVLHIREDILKKRACLRCMNLLKDSDRTVKQLRERLERDAYPEDTIRHALDYVASFHYTDDQRYAQNYIRQMSGRKSRKQIEFELLKKGVDRETVRAALSEENEAGSSSETDAILALARKRGYDPETASREETAKLLRYLLGKGFGYESIRSALPAARGMQ